MSLGTEEGLGPGNIVLDGDPAPPRKWAHQPLAFRSMSIVAKRSPISTTAELLLYVLSSELRYASENATYGRKLTVTQKPRLYQTTRATLYVTANVL